LRFWFDLPAFAQARYSSARKVKLSSGSELLFNDGRAAYWQKRYRDAVRMFRQAALIRPERALTHYYLGLSWAALGNFAEAEKAYHEALRRDPDNNLARNGLGELYREADSRNRTAASDRTAVQKGTPSGSKPASARSGKKPFIARPDRSCARNSVCGSIRRRAQ
jgi:tetratricopeptide (TPR) repeat protein